MKTTIQFFHQGVEMTTRHELLAKYPVLTHNKLQRILERPVLAPVAYKNQYYFEKASTEQLIEKLLGMSVTEEIAERASATPTTMTSDMTHEQRLDVAHAKLNALNSMPTPVEAFGGDDEMWF